MGWHMAQNDGKDTKDLEQLKKDMMDVFKSAASSIKTGYFSNAESRSHMIRAAAQSAEAIVKIEQELRARNDDSVKKITR